VLHAFGSSAEQVHFVATSATIGSGDEAARLQLQEFLSSLAGVTPDRVTVIYGERSIPALGVNDTKIAENHTIEELQQLNEDANGLYKRLAVNPVAKRIRSLFLPTQSGQNYQTLSSVRNALNVGNDEPTELKALEWLDLLTSAVSGEGRTAKPFLPLRMHAFHNTLNGMWACTDAKCSAKKNTI
jgi:hypothetical protein